MATYRDLLAYWCFQRGDEAAVWVSGRRISYRQLLSDVRNLKGRLSRSALRRGDIVVVDISSSLYLHWVALIALDFLGCATVSRLFRQPDVDALRWIDADAIVSSAPLDWVGELARTVEVSLDCLTAEAGAADDPTPDSPQAPDDLVRIILSSGTTGTPKQIPIRRAELHARINRPGDPPGAYHSLTTLGVDTVGGFQSPWRTWYRGGTVVLTNKVNAYILRQSGADYLSLSPQQCANLLAEDEAVFRGPRRTVLELSGSTASAALMQALKRRGGVDVYVVYGATEVAGTSMCPADVALKQPGAVGYAGPDCEVEIVSPGDGRPLGAGQLGEVRLRALGMAQAYRHADEAAARHLRDGWFYPGDLGSLDDDGLLVLQGRVNDVLNVGGYKLAASRVEATALQRPGVKDAAACVLQMESGRTRLVCAVVVAPGFIAEDLGRTIRSEHGVDALLVGLPEIPRNAMGKIVRREVERMAAGAIPKPAGST